MTQEDKVQRIISEVERRWRELAEKNVKAGGNKYDGEISQLLSILTFINDLEKEEEKKEVVISQKDKETQERYDRWWRIMNIPMGEIPQEDLEWAVQEDEFNSYQSKKNFEWEIERRKNTNW